MHTNSHLGQFCIVSQFAVMFLGGGKKLEETHMDVGSNPNSGSNPGAV